MIRKSFTTLAALALCVTTLMPASALGQNANLPPQATEHRAEASNPTHFDTTSRPLRDMVETIAMPAKARGGREFEPGRPTPVGNTNPKFDDPLAARGVTSSSATVMPKASTIGTPIDPNARVAPPDTTGDLGPNHYVQWVNLRYSIYTLSRDALNNITGFNLVSGFPKQGNVIWQGFGGQCETANDGDPIVQYDQLADRWVLTQFAVASSPFLQCVAVSTGPDPTGTYHRYAYSYGTDFNDYPKMGVWPNGYYITYNMFKRGRTFAGNQVCAFERDKMLIGAPARQICARTTAGSSLEPAASQHHLDGFAVLEIRRQLDGRNGHAHGPGNRPRRCHLRQSVQRRRVHPATGHDAETRLSGRPSHVSPELSQVPRRSRVNGDQPLRHGGHGHGYSLV
jgi:hypothetical protein